MITIQDYFGPWEDHDDVTGEVIDNALELLGKVNDLIEVAFADEVDFPLNPVTKSHIAGKTYGGFRPQDCPQGAPTSSHKTGKGIDIYDPKHTISRWCFLHQAELKERGLYMEHPSATPTWCHLTTRAPGSGKTCFHP
jgi:hypothetical protein